MDLIMSRKKKIRRFYEILVFCIALNFTGVEFNVCKLDLNLNFSQKNKQQQELIERNDIRDVYVKDNKVYILTKTGLVICNKEGVAHKLN